MLVDEGMDNNKEELISLVLRQVTDGLEVKVYF